MHETLIGLHFHADEAAGLEVACECGIVLLAEEGFEALLQLSEVNEIARNHRDNAHLP
jgi:hypothetical protein